MKERNLAGGTVSLISSGAVLVNDGATIDVSGGAINWQAGSVRTSTLLGKDGKVYDIANADRDREYVAVLDSQTVKDQRWGTTATYNFYGRVNLGTPEAAYVEGKDAGSVSIVAPRTIFDGVIDGRTTIGANQRLAPAALAAGQLYRNYDQLPLGARLSLGLSTPDTSASVFNYVTSDVHVASGGATLAGLKNADNTPFDPLKDPLPVSAERHVAASGLLGANSVSRLGDLLERHSDRAQRNGV